jgi:acyl carrier protein
VTNQIGTSQTGQTTEDIVVVAIAAQLDSDRDDIDLDIPMLALPGMESILLLRAIAEIEDVSGVLIPDDALVETVTVRDLVALVTELQERG